MSNRIAAITGASAGLGSVFARKLAQQGYDLLLIARRRDRLESLAAGLSGEYGVAVEPFSADLADPEGIARVAARLATEHRLHLLVNNAGFGTKGRLWETPLEGQVAMHRVHMDAIMQLSRSALRGMTARNEGAIINVSSVAAFARSAANVSYCATKAWINAFTEGLALELKGTNVAVQALCPGFTYTEFHDVMGADRAAVPRWLWMNADEVVDASLAALAGRRLFVVPGWKYRMFVVFVTRLPASWRVALEARSPHTRSRL